MNFINKPTKRYAKIQQKVASQGLKKVFDTLEVKRFFIEPSIIFIDFVAQLGYRNKKDMN